MMEHRCIKARKADLKKSRSNAFSNEVKERVTLEYFQSKSSSLITSTCHERIPRSSNYRISKRIISFDEQYLSHCLELIQINAAKAVKFSVTLSPKKTISSAESNFPSPRNVLTFSSKRWPLDSEAKSESMILQSPNFEHGTGNNDNNSEDFSFPSVRGSLDSSYGDVSPNGFSICSSPLVEFESSKRFHGLLRCTRRNGITHFEFSTDHRGEMYTTSSSKSSALSDGSSHDWVYFINLSASNRKEPNVRKLESSLVGKINVTTRYKISADGSKTMETEFVLYGDNECLEDKLDESTSSYDTGKRRRLPGKVSNFFKPLHLPKHRWGTSTSLDLSSMTPEDDEGDDSDQLRCPNLLESEIPSNFELAAIVVKEQVELMQQKGMGGWGLNFLMRASEKQATDSTHDCKSTVERSMDVIVPTGFHGGPKPFSIIERSRNGGYCDCGGWDTGCPVSQLTTRLDKESVRKSLDLYLKGEEGCVRGPSMKMVNIQHGLYSIEYVPRLSALQCFSIAVAVIHCRNPTLRSNTQTS